MAAASVEKVVLAEQVGELLGKVDRKAEVLATSAPPAAMATAGLPGSPVANEATEVFATLFLTSEFPFLLSDSTE